jgi:DNA-binding response OmpR family regulator
VPLGGGDGADHRPGVTEAYATSFASEGLASLGMQPQEFREWFTAASPADIEGMQGVVVGEFEGRANCSELVRKRTQVPILALAEVRNLSATLELLSIGVDDVLRTPVHVREIVARSSAIWRRINRISEQTICDRLKIFFDGRDIEVDGEPMILPRRERRILEFLAKNANRRVTKSQIFNAVYGVFEENVDEVVVEGHISKLRKKLRIRLGCDVIDAKRYLGYQFVGTPREDTKLAPTELTAGLSGIDSRAVDRSISLIEVDDKSQCRKHVEAALRRNSPFAVHCLRIQYPRLLDEELAAACSLSGEVTERISKRTRGTDVVHPHNADELMLIQSTITRDADALGFANRIADALSQPFVINGRQVAVAVSIGVAVAPRHGTTPDGLLTAASMALGNGRDNKALVTLAD